MEGGELILSHKWAPPLQHAICPSNIYSLYTSLKENVYMFNVYSYMPPILKGYLPLLWQRLDLNKPQIFANIVPINFAQLWHLVQNPVQQQYRSLFHQLLAFLSSCYGELAEPSTKHKIWKTWQSLQKNWQKCAWPQNLSSGGIPAFLMYALPHHQQGSIDFNKSGYIGLVKNFIHALYDHKREFVKR